MKAKPSFSTLTSVVQSGDLITSTGSPMMNPQFSSSSLSVNLGSSMTRSVSAATGISALAAQAASAGHIRQPQQYQKEKEGHLFKRSQPKGIPVPTWSRR